MKPTFRNLHVPLPGDLYARLRTTAARERRPATHLAREAIQSWLEAKQKERIAQEIREYTKAVAGTSDDLDEAMEQAGVECLLESTSYDEVSA